MWPLLTGQTEPRFGGFFFLSPPGRLSARYNPRVNGWYDFTVEHGGTTYRCKRLVHGFRTTQIVIVAGVGSKHDPQQYGPGFRPIEEMEAAAHSLAHAIIARVQELSE